MSSLKISIVTPTLNAGPCLLECIESVRNNRDAGVRLEHIIVDGGSTDGTVELAQSMGARVMVGKDSGIFDAINRGSFAADGDLLGFLGADDTLLPGAAKTIGDFYVPRAHRWITGGVKWTGPDGELLADVSAPPAWLGSRMFASLGWCCIWHMATFVSKDFFRELGGFDIKFRDAGDYEFFARALQAQRFGRVPSPLASYRRTGLNNSSLPANQERIRRECESVAQKYGPSSARTRSVYRSLLKIWVNAGNPGWFRYKHLPSASAPRARDLS
jgi:glycosyltransferase involved in cell wall biosynthesis